MSHDPTLDEKLRTVPGASGASLTPSISRSRGVRTMRTFIDAGTKQRGCHALCAALIAIAAARLVISLNKSPQGWSGITYMEVVYGQSREVSSGAAGPETATKRKWGPLFVALMIGVGRLPMAERTLSGALRLALFALYGVTVYLLSRLFSTVAWPWTAAETAWRRTILIVLCLQSSAAIYAIANGMGEIVTAFCVVGHFYCFSQRRYRAAAILMAIGIYFKLYPIVFAFPYFAFSALSREHRRYCRDLAVAGMATAVISLIISGWKFGFFYPLSMIASVMTDADLIPILSREVFSPISVVARAAGSFKVRPVDAQAI